MKNEELDEAFNEVSNSLKELVDTLKTQALDELKKQLSDYSYKNYEIGDVWFEKTTLVGEIANIPDIVTFESKNASGFKKAFEQSVDDYLEY